MVFEAHMVVGRIHFLTVVECKVACLFKVNGTELLLLAIPDLRRSGPSRLIFFLITQSELIMDLITSANFTFACKTTQSKEQPSSFSGILLILKKGLYISVAGILKSFYNLSYHII